jgi:hypothetical protein
VTSEALTDALGVAAFSADTSCILASEGGFVPVVLSSSAPGFSYSAAQLMVPLKNPRPEVTITQPYEGETLNEDTVLVRGYAQDANGIQSVAISVDGGAPVMVPGVAGDPYWTFELTVSGLADGEHTVAITAMDSLYVSGSALRGFEVGVNSVTLVKYGGGPSESAVQVLFVPEADGIWVAFVENDGLKALEIDLYDLSSGLPVQVAHLKVLLGKYPTGTVAVEETVPMAGGSEYLLVFTPVGPEGGSATVAWVYSA